MNKIDPRPPLVSIDHDFALWCAQQGRLLREGRMDSLDRDNLAEEIESLGRSDKYEIENRLEVLLLHLLKWAHQPKKRKTGWQASIVEQRIRIRRRIKESPSLQSYPQLVLEDAYRLARAGAASETRLPLESFPEDCPFDTEQVLDDDFLPGDR